ncbi:MAG: TraR/DksA family transcriptional regulator [Patescibacteria group bacterium]|nr:TraR/DksA family transcriptional regulator [Patescibacteria group bacterium]
MNQTKLKHFKEKLLAEQAILWDELSSFAKQDERGDWVAIPAPHTDGGMGDDADQAAFTEEIESKVGLLGSLEQKYNQIRDALVRIEDGTYGTCLKSGKPIEEDRLEANPSAETCKQMMNG